MHQVGELFDAVEINAFHTTLFDFNRPAARWGGIQGKPLIGCSDAQRLSILGKTFSLVDAHPSPAAICSAIKRGHVRVVASPLASHEAAVYVSSLTWATFRAPRARRPRVDTTWSAERF
jgi:hypothetical protein